VLSWACRRFRARFTPGDTHPHRRACAECDAFATALEQGARVRLPLPVSLRSNLQSIQSLGARESGAILPFPVPRLPMPESLVARLRSIPPASRPAPPEWVRSPRYALAASALLALLLGPLMASAADRGQRALNAVRVEVSPLLDHAGTGSRKELEKLRLATAATYDTARESVADSLHRFDAGLSGLSIRLSNVLSEDLNHSDARHEPDRPSDK
jgi:hypothetical protein